MLVCFLQLVTAIAVFKHSFRSYHKGIQCNLSQLQLPFHLSGWHWCKFAIIIGRRWRARRIIWIATLILGFLGVPWCSHLLGLQWCSLLGLDWCSLFGLDRRSLVGIHWRSLLRVHWCGHAKDSEQVALQAEVYEEFIITRTVFVDKFERWLANHYLGHLLKFFDQEEGQSVVERWITTNQPSSSRFVAKSWRRTMSPGTAILFGSKPKTELMLAQSVPSIFHTKVALVFWHCAEWCPCALQCPSRWFLSCTSNSG